MFKLDTILNITKCENGKEVPYIYFETTVNDDPKLNRFGIKVDKFIVDFKEEYDEHNIYRQFYNTLDTLDILKKNLVIDSKISDELQNRQIFLNINSLSNMIAVNGRIGSHNFIIANDKYAKIYESFGQFICDVNIDDTLGNKIIIGRKNNITDPGIHCFHDDVQMCITPLGPSTHLQYAILKIKYD